MDLTAFRNAVLDEASLILGDVFLTTAILDRFINRAYKWAVATHPWSQSEMAEERDSQADQEFYDIPDNWIPDSISKLRYLGEPYKKVLFRDYLRYQDTQEANATDKIFAEFQGKYFINPTPTASGSRDIEVWGFEIPADLSETTDVTIFNNDAEIEEAIVEYAQGLALRKKGGKWYKDGVIRQDGARVRIERSWLSQRKKEADFKTHDSEFFETPDFLEDVHGSGRGNVKSIGKFSI